MGSTATGSRRSPTSCSSTRSSTPFSATWPTVWTSPLSRRLSTEAEAGRLSQAMAAAALPRRRRPPRASRADKAAELVDQQRQSLFQDWFDKQLRTARIRVDKHFGRWDAGRGVVQ